MYSDVDAVQIHEIDDSRRDDREQDFPAEISIFFSNRPKPCRCARLELVPKAKEKNVQRTAHELKARFCWQFISLIEQIEDFSTCSLFANWFDT